jgi:hypothetical protein
MHTKETAPTTTCPLDLKLAMHVTPGDTYEWSKVLLARAKFDGTMQLLTAAWENALGFGRRELADKTLGELMRSARPEAVVAAILDESHCAPVDLTLRCASGAAKRFRFHRRVDDYLRQVFIVAEQKPSSVHDAALSPDDAGAPPGRPPLRLTR